MKPRRGWLVGDNNRELVGDWTDLLGSLVASVWVGNLDCSLGVVSVCLVESLLVDDSDCEGVGEIDGVLVLEELIGSFELGSVVSEDDGVVRNFGGVLLVGDCEGVLVCASLGGVSLVGVLLVGVSLVGDCEGVLVCVSFGGLLVYH